MGNTEAHKAGTEVQPMHEQNIIPDASCVCLLLTSFTFHGYHGSAVGSQKTSPAYCKLSKNLSVDLVLPSAQEDQQ